MASLDLRNLTRRRAPVFPFEKARKAILPAWDISLVFMQAAQAQALNKRLRRKSYVPNVLSYETGTRSGEVIICLSVAKEQVPSYGMPYPIFVGFLFIHALLHLLGKPHGSTMEKAERQLLARIAPNYPIHGTSHRSRHRHRDVPSKGRRR